MAADDSLKVRNGAIPSRCGSAPPCFEEAFAAIRNSLVARQSAVKNSVQNSEAEEKFLTDPAYVAYYDANVNLNPRLPPPLISREGRHLVGRNAYLGYARRLPSTHEEQLEEDMFRQEQQPFEYQTQVKDELMARSTSVSSAVQDNVAAHDPTTSDIAGAATILKALNISGASESKHTERKHEDRLLCETYGLPFYPPIHNIQQLQRFQMFPSAQPNFTGIRPMMLSPGFLPAPYMVAGSEFGPGLQTLSPFGPQIGPGGCMFTPPFDPYVDFNLFNRATEVQRAFPDLFQGQYVQHTLRNKYEKESEFAAFTHHHPRNLPIVGDNYLISTPVFSPSIRFPVDGRNHLALRDHTSIPQCSLENAQFHTRKKFHRGSNYLEDPESISLLEELKLGGGSKLELSDIAGKAVEFSTDQHGSRFIQQQLEVSTLQEKESIFTELLPLAAQLMTDVFGNYVIQKLFEHGTSDQRKQLADQFTGRILTLSLHMYGCRVIQKAIEVIDPHQKELLAQELNGYVISCVHDQNGNHVVQKCIEHIPAGKISFIISALRCEVATLSVHPYGCRVIQRVLEHCSYDSSTQFIMDEILESVCMLAQDQYGNYVIQHVLKLGKPHERSEIISKLAGKVVEMSQHKYASNVIEKCLIHGNASEQESVVREVLEHSDGDANLLAMMKDPYANYVIQRIREICGEEERKILMKCVGENIQSLKKYTYGKHIVALYEEQV